MPRQRDLAAPSGWDRTDTTDAPDDRPDTLRRLLWRRIDGDQTELRVVAEEVGVSSYWLTAYLRGEEECDDLETVGRLDIAARRG